MFEAVLKRVLQAIFEASVDRGVADATSEVDHLDDSSKDWPVDAFTNLIVEITDGTGAEQIRKIDSNTATSLVPVTDFTTAPDATSQYRIGFFGKMASDITAWGGTALTGRDISLDLKALTDDSITGLLRSIGDIAALENLITRIGQTSDDAVDAGATGSVAAKLRRVTQGLEDLKTLIALAANSGVDIGDVDVLTVGDEPLTYSAPATVNVGVATTQILAANADRRYACIVNDSDTTIYLAVGANAVAGSGIRINANGGVAEFIKGRNLTTQAINGIHDGVGNKVVTVQEAE